MGTELLRPSIIYVSCLVAILTTMFSYEIDGTACEVSEKTTSMRPWYTFG